MPSTLPPESGSLLVADFQSVLMNLAMTQVAAHEADRSEQALLGQLNDLGGSGYLSPGSLTDTDQSDITRDSLNVHVKKVQAQQMANLSAQQMAELIQQANTSYVGRRVMVTALDPKNPPIDAVWYNQESGYYSSQFKKRRITGTIKAIQLEQNTLIVKPSFQRRFIVPNLQEFIVYVIDPASLTPMITLEIL